MLLVTQEISERQDERNALLWSKSDDPQQIQSIIDRLELLNTGVNAMMNTLMSVIEMNTNEPVRVLGIRCEGWTAVTIVYSLFLFLIGLLQYLIFGGSLF